MSDDGAPVDQANEGDLTIEQIAAMGQAKLTMLFNSGFHGVTLDGEILIP